VGLALFLLAIVLRDAGWAIAAVTAILAAATYVLARHTENLADETAKLARHTERATALDAAREKRAMLQKALEHAERIRQLQPELFIGKLIDGFMPGRLPGEAWDFRALITYAALIDDEVAVERLREFCEAIDDLEQASYSTGGPPRFQLQPWGSWMEKLRVLQAHLLGPTRKWRDELDRLRGSLAEG